jgi:2-dehydro-3-deoxyglucarate aldolase/4-hydroxy-2-oxoheptanedioate aldolase
MRENRLKRILATGQVPVGHMVVEFWTRGLAKMLDSVNLDFVIFDMEHTGATTADLADQLAWCKATSMTAIVRPPALDYEYISRAMDAGAHGVMVPRIRTVDEVERVVQAVKYPPEGRRGISFRLAHDDFRDGDGTQKMEEANRESIVIVQIETVEALDAIEEIAAVPGVDVVWPGQYDLTASMGILGQFDHPRLQEGIERVVAAAQAAGKTAGIQPTSVDQAIDWVQQGFRCISYSEDMLVYLDACIEQIGELRRRVSVIDSVKEAQLQ